MLAGLTLHAANRLDLKQWLTDAPFSDLVSADDQVVAAARARLAPPEAEAEWCEDKDDEVEEAPQGWHAAQLGKCRCRRTTEPYWCV